MLDRTLSQCQHKFTSSNCKVCGIYNHSQDIALKTNLYDTYLNCSAQKYLKHMRRRKSSILQLKDLHEETYSLLLSICDKFEYGIQTLALGVYVYAKTYGKQQKWESQERFWASTSLIVASKAIELDRKVPYLNRFQRYAQKSYSQCEYEAGERKIFELLNHDIQYTTFISFINFYLTNGIVFKSDALFPCSLKYLQDDVMDKARDYIKNGQFLKFDAEKLALRIIKEIRSKYRLTSWTTGISKISGFNSQEIGDLNEKDKLKILKPGNNLCVKKSGKLNSSLSINLDLLSSSNLIEQKFKSCKKRSEPSTTTSSSLTLYRLQSMKQNSSKDSSKLQTNQNTIQNMETTAPLAVLRNQLTNASSINVNTSINKIIGVYLGDSIDKRIPLNTFEKRM